MSAKWSETYSGQLRQLVGHRKLIIPSIRAIIQNESGEVLFIRRRGDRSWALPAGAIELDESIFQCLQREVNEETGLHVHAETLLAIYTEPRFSVTTRYGDQFQGFEFLYRVDEWSGALRSETDETIDAAFFPMSGLPTMRPGYWADHHQEVFADFISFNGSPKIK